MPEQVQSSVTAPPTQPEASKQSSWTLRRIVIVAAAALGGIIILIFVFGLLLALFSDVEATAARIQIIRDIFFIMIGLEFILIIGAVAILILQIARTTNLVQSEVKPVLKDAQEAVSSAKGTVDFVGKNVTEPIVKTGAFLAGAGVFMREVGGIRRAIRPTRKAKQIEHE
jgi:hypothetical protein